MATANVTNATIIPTPYPYPPLLYVRFISTLYHLGFFHIVVPFFLIFSMVFGLLQKTKLLGENVEANMIVAACVGFLVIGVPAAVLAIQQFAAITTMFLFIAFSGALVGSIVIKEGIENLDPRIKFLVTYTAIVLMFALIGVVLNRVTGGVFYSLLLGTWPGLLLCIFILFILPGLIVLSMEKKRRGEGGE